MMMEPIRKRDAQHALLTALRPMVEPAELISARSTPWASATFDGARHKLAIVLTGADGPKRAARLAAELPEAEFALRDHFVAEIAATWSGETLTIEALTIVAD